MTALETLQATLQDARTEAATLRIENTRLREALDRAVAFVEGAIQVGELDPRNGNTADNGVDEGEVAWSGMLYDCRAALGKQPQRDVTEPAGGPEQDRGAAAIRPAPIDCAPLTREDSTPWERGE